METLETFSDTEKVAQHFYCVCCDYKTSRRNNFAKHLLTRKHQKSSNGNTGNKSSTENKAVKAIYKSGNNNKNFIEFFATQFGSALDNAIAKINCLWLTSPPTHSLTLPTTYWRTTCIQSYNKNMYTVLRATRVHREPQVVPRAAPPKHQLGSH